MFFLVDKEKIFLIMVIGISMVLLRNRYAISTVQFTVTRQ